MKIKRIMNGVFLKSDKFEVDDAAEALEYDFYTDTEVCLFENSNVPYHHNLKKNLVFKSNILINGFIPPAAQRFSVDLCAHDKYRSKKSKDIILHFNPRFEQNCVVRNSYVNSDWGLEEVHATKKNPFKRGQMFIMEIYVLKSQYLISVNGVHFCGFTHRIHPSNVDSLDISGDLQLLKVELSLREMYPSTERSIFLLDDPHTQTKYPFFHQLKYPLMEMWDLIIIGSVLDNADRFAVDLCASSDNCSKPYKNIVFHFNPRLSQNYVARNSYICEEWGIEESHANQKSPFQRGNVFILEFFFTENAFLVSIDGKHFCTFRHRLPASDVDSIEVHGDVALKRIDVSRKSCYPTQEESLFQNLIKMVQTITLPVTQRLAEPLSVNTIIEIKGRIMLLPYEFYINLQNGTLRFPHPVIPYHISIRWRPMDSDSNSIVMNTWINDTWQDEIIYKSYLRPNMDFTITIYVKNEGFSTVIKTPVKPYSTVFPPFTHRMDPSIIDTIYLQGDVQIYSFNVKKL